MKKNTGKEFELFVKEVQKKLGPEVEVLHNQHLKDKKDILRQFDVVLKGRFASHEVLGVIECKDWKSKVGMEAVEAFANKADSVGATLRIFVSRNGFTENALLVAKENSIQTYTIISDKFPQNFKIGCTALFVKYFWSNEILISVSNSNYYRDFSVAPKLTLSEVEGWIKCYLNKVSGDHEERLGMHTIKVNFYQPTVFSSSPNNQPFEVSELTCKVNRLVEYREFTEFIDNFDGFYDFNCPHITFAPGAKMDMKLDLLKIENESIVELSDLKENYFHKLVKYVHIPIDGSTNCDLEKLGKINHSCIEV